jgi:hypothetical protein
MTPAILLLSSLATAGEHRPICEKVAAADLVYEMRFTQVGRYLSSHRAKQWGPHESELIKTAKTGEVSQVFKGTIKVGAPWIPAFGTGFQVSSSVAKWDEFFAQKAFSKVFFLVKKGETYRSTGWAEETAGCGSSDHWSWCEAYPAFKAAVQACLAKK